MFKLAMLGVMFITYLFSVNNGPEILGGEDADGLSQGASAKLSSYSVISGESSTSNRNHTFNAL